MLCYMRLAHRMAALKFEEAQHGAKGLKFMLQDRL